MVAASLLAAGAVNPTVLSPAAAAAWLHLRRGPFEGIPEPDTILDQALLAEVTPISEKSRVAAVCAHWAASHPLVGKAAVASRDLCVKLEVPQTLFVRALCSDVCPSPRILWCVFRC